MTPEAQRIAIAEAFGWKQEPSPFSDKLIWITPRGLTAGGVQDALTGLPDYLNDLNAMHEAEKVLMGDGYKSIDYRRLYMQKLGRIVGAWHGEDGSISHPDTWAESFILSHATATQRSEAFLKCLGLWKD